MFAVDNVSSGCNMVASMIVQRVIIFLVSGHGKLFIHIKVPHSLSSIGNEYLALRVVFILVSTY